MLSAYPAYFFKEENGYSVIFPDLNYLSTCGDSLEAAFSMAIDCLAAYLYWLKEDNETAPTPSSMEQLDLAAFAQELELDSADGFINIVTVDVDEYAKIHFEKSVKKTLTIPLWLNTAALQQNINFSQVLQDALKEKLRTKKAAPH